MYNNVHFSSGPDPLNVRTIDHGALPLIHAMHRRGIRIDVPYLAALDSEILTKQQDLESQIPSLIGNAYTDLHKGKRVPFSIGSPDHVARLLFHHLRIHGDDELRLTKGKTREAVDDDVLALYKDRHPIVPVISDWRELNKLHTTYTGPDCIRAKVDSDSRIHTRFTVTVAATGRLSSRDPNLQNLPSRGYGKKVRNSFIASPGHVLVSNDLSQIEMRWAAHRSQDPTMVDVFWNKEDVHDRTTCNVFGLDYTSVAKMKAAVKSGKADKALIAKYNHFSQFQRLPCKTVGFGVLYGQTAEGLQKSLATEGVRWELTECQDLIENKFFGVYPGLRSMLERDYATARRYAIIWDDFGRVRLVPEAKSVHSWIREEGIRKAGNHPEQSGATNGLKLGKAELPKLYADFDGAAHALLSVHDEIISECEPQYVKQFAFELSNILERAVPLTVPVESSSDIAERWGELK